MSYRTPAPESSSLALQSGRSALHSTLLGTFEAPFPIELAGPGSPGRPAADVAVYAVHACSARCGAASAWARPRGRAAQVSLERYDAFSDLDPAVRPQPPGGERDLDLWRRRGRGEPHPLLRYGWRSELPIALGKDMADPDRVATYEVRDRGAAGRRGPAPLAVGRPVQSARGVQRPCPAPQVCCWRLAAPTSSSTKRARTHPRFLVLVHCRHGHRCLRTLGLLDVHCMDSRLARQDCTPVAPPVPA